MNAQPAPVLPALSTAGRGRRPDASAARPSGWCLGAVWLAWIVVAALALGLFVLGIPARRDELHHRLAGLIGLDAHENRAGEIVLSPWRDAPVARAGLLEGDILVAIDRRPVRDSSGLRAADALASGVIGAPVELDVRTGNRPARTLVITRGGDEARALAPLHLTPSVVTALALGVDILSAAVVATVAGLIVWKRATDWLALMVSATLLFLGTASPIVALYTSRPGWQPPLDLWFGLAFASLLAFFYLFPDGHLVPRWTGALAGALAIWIVAAVIHPSLYPWRMSSPRDVWVMAGWLSTGVAAQAYRYRSWSDVTQRQQTKWVVLGGTAAALGILGRFFLPRLLWPDQSGLGPLREDLVIFPVSQLLQALLPLSIGIALLRHRLWDVDILIRRALVYGTLTVSIAGLYVLVVGALGALLQGNGSLAGSMVATGVVAILFQPLRERLQRAVNRLLYGDRDDPYAVLSRLGQHLEMVLAPEAVLPAIVETVAQALKLPYVAIALRDGAGFTIVATTGNPAPTPLTLPLTHQGDLVGRLMLLPRGPGEGFGPADRRLLDDVAHQAGVAAHAVRLTAELQRSRERLVTAQEEERRRLRRDLHDGLGPTLATFPLKLDAARNLLTRDPAAVEGLLTDLKGQTQAAIADIRRLVYALRPPALDELGLVAALRAHAAQYDDPSHRADPSDAPGDGRSLRVLVEASEPLPPLPAAVEVAVYRIALEALTNVARHAHAGSCHVRLMCDGALELEVHDDGRGLPAGARAGVGLTAMRERAAELGGTCTIGVGPTGGTLVRARFPLATPDSGPVMVAERED